MAEEELSREVLIGIDVVEAVAAAAAAAAAAVAEGGDASRADEGVDVVDEAGAVEAVDVDGAADDQPDETFRAISFPPQSPTRYRLWRS